jgi:hypothetical protein
LHTLVNNRDSIAGIAMFAGNERVSKGGRWIEKIHYSNPQFAIRNPQFSPPLSLTSAAAAATENGLYAVKLGRIVKV